jgi:predicted GNAT family acetyltransferase
MSEINTPQFSDNAVSHRFELVEDGLTAFAEYSLRGSQVVIPHVESPMALRGKGTASRLMHAVAEHARSEHLTIAPLCGYARAWFRRHPEYADVLG